MRNYYSILTWPALQLGDFEDWSIVDFTRSFISCSVCNPFEEMSSAAIASNISPMSSISSMLFVFLAAIWMRFRLNLRKMKFKTKPFDCEKSYFPWFLWYKSIVNSHSKNWRIWGGATEIRGVRVSYNRVYTSCQGTITEEGSLCLLRKHKCLGLVENINKRIDNNKWLLNQKVKLTVIRLRRHFAFTWTPFWWNNGGYKTQDRRSWWYSWCYYFDDQSKNSNQGMQNPSTDGRSDLQKSKGSEWKFGPE